MYFISEAICRKRNLALSSVYFPKKIDYNQICVRRCKICNKVYEFYD